MWLLQALPDVADTVRYWWTGPGRALSSYLEEPMRLAIRMPPCSMPGNKLCLHHFLRICCRLDPHLAAGWSQNEYLEARFGRLWAW